MLLIVDSQFQYDANFKSKNSRRVLYESYLSEAAAEIMGGSEVHVEAGSTLNLTCVVRNSRERPHYLLWYHSNEVTRTILS